MRFLKKFIRDDLLRHSVILMSGMMVVHLCNMVFQMAISRALPKEEYTLLIAFLGLLAIIQRPLFTLRAAVSYHASLLKQEGRIGDIKRLIGKWLVLSGFATLALGFVGIYFAKSLAAFFHLSREAPVLIAVLLLPALFGIPILGGAGQGLQIFKWGAASNVANALARLLLGAGFVWFMYPACGWAMLGHGVGLYIALAVWGIGLLFQLKGARSGHLRLPSMRLYLLHGFFIQAACAILMTADIVLVKHYVPDDTDFAYAATLGRLVTSLTAVVPMAMFPKVSSKGVFTKTHRDIYFRGLLYSVAFAMGGIALCCLIPEYLHLFFFRITDANTNLLVLTRVTAVVMGISTLLGINISFLLAQRRFSGARIAVVFAVTYLFSVHFSHSSSLQIVLLAGLFNLLALIGTTIVILRSRVTAEE